MKKSELVVGETYAIRYRKSLKGYSRGYWSGGGTRYEEELKPGVGKLIKLSAKAGQHQFELPDGTKVYASGQSILEVAEPTPLQKKVEKKIAELEAKGLDAKKRKELLGETLIMLSALGVAAKKAPGDTGIIIDADNAVALNGIIIDLMGKELLG